MRVRRGTVVEFDDPRGIGTVRAAAALSAVGDEALAEAPFPFHCVSITDGSRTIGVDQAVTFVVRPGHRGRWEATEVTPL